MTTLDTGDHFPSMVLSLPDDEKLTLPDALAGHYGVVLFYRGSWCSFCNAQLRAFQRSTAALAEVDVRVVAVSVDDEATTQETISKHGLEFPVAYGADAHQIAQSVGAFTHDDPSFVHSTGFVLGPDGRVLVSVYSSGAIGRLVPEDVVGLVGYVRSH